MTALVLLGKHLIWSRTNPDGGTTSYYYDDRITWVVVTVVLFWIIWLAVRGYLRARALRRRSRATNQRQLRRVVRIKQELTSHYLRLGFSKNIHAIGVGKLSLGGEYCIQFFVSDPNAEMWNGSGRATLAASYRGVPLTLIEMPIAGFLAAPSAQAEAQSHQSKKGIREHQEVIIGGISAANLNLTGESGTIGYFCTRRSKLPRRKEIHLLSNSHVFADLRKTEIDDGDLIMQPSPGEPAHNRPIASLVNFSRVVFAGDVKNPNHIDAAIARLWGPQPHRALIPLTGSVAGYVQKKDVEIGETVRKFGRTTGYTEGRIFSTYLDIWIRYDRTGASAFFQDQFLVEPAQPEFTQFVAKGDSGSLLVDSKQHAVGLIFGGMADLPETQPELRKVKNLSAASQLKRIESYGVANPISDVLDRLKIDLLV